MSKLHPFWYLRVPEWITVDFTTGTEVDPKNKLSQTATRATFTNLGSADEWTYLYWDYGVGYFTGDFTQRVDIEVSTSTSYAWVSQWALVQVLEDITDFISVEYAEYLDELRLVGRYNGGDYHFDGYTITKGTTYYLLIERVNNTITCKIYSDSARTILLHILSITLEAAPAYRYLTVTSNAFSGWGVGSSTGYVENLGLLE